MRSSRSTTRLSSRSFGSFGSARRRFTVRCYVSFGGVENRGGKEILPHLGQCLHLVGPAVQRQQLDTLRSGQEQAKESLA